MALTLTYDPVLSRVQITADAFAGAGQATVERSTNQVTWTTVRGGAEVPVPGAGLVLPGTSGNYTSTPDNAALDITGDIDLRADVTLDDWNTGANQTLISKFAGAGARSYIFRMTISGGIGLLWSTDGTALISVESTVSPAVVDGARLAVRATLDVDNGAGGNTVTFYTAPTITGPWTQLGAPVVTGGVTSIFSSSTQVEIGSHTNGTTNLTAGTVHAAQVRNGIDGTQVANPIFGDQPTGTTSFADAASRTWTVNTSGSPAANIVHDEIKLDDYEFAPDVANYYRVAGQTANVTPVLDGVWLKSLARPFLNRKVTVVDYSDVERSSRGGVFPIVGRSFPVAVTDLHGSRQWTLDVLADTAQEAEDLDLLISTGEVQFVHVPAAERVPGGYVALGNTTERRPGRRSIRRVFSMPLTEVAAPGPDVVPAVGTWQSVLNSYATWADVLAAHPTWESLLQLVGSPADVIVP